MCGLLGMGLPLQSTLSACSSTNATSDFTGRVLVIGAGAGGLTAGYLLNQQGIDFTILEASGNVGGRMKRTRDFADFPIPLGAEWVHVPTGIFEEIVNDSTVNVDVATTPYDPAVDFGLFQGEQISVADVGFTIDQKFIGSTWFDFFDTYITPSVQNKIRFINVVEAIDYSGDIVRVRTANETFEAEKVIVAVPVKMLQRGAITFTPALPSNKAEAIAEVTVWDGCKAFIEFSTKFYPTFTAFEIVPETAGQKLYYDAAYGQNTTRHILGLFAVGTGTQPYVDLSDNALIAYMLDELDAIYDNQASASYVKHIFQNWNAEPYAQGAYVVDHENWRRVRTLGTSIDDTVYFAGDAYTTGDDWSSVHAAARSAKRAVEELLG